MNWKTTASLAATFVVLLGVRSFWKPSTPQVLPNEMLFPALDVDYMKIEIVAKERPEIILERRDDARTGAAWWLAKPLDAPAWEPHVAEMFSGLRELMSSNTLGKTPADLPRTVTGLDDPEVIAKIQTRSGHKTVRFGRPLVKDPSLRWFEIVGDEKLYFGSQKAFDPFFRSVQELRHRGVAFLSPIQVSRARLHARFERARTDGGRPVRTQDGKPVMEFAWDVSEIRKLSAEQHKSGLEGWYWVSQNGQPREEHLNGDLVARFFAELGSLLAEDFAAFVDPAAYGLDYPVLRFEVWQGEAQPPVEIAVGKTEEVKGRRISYLRVGNSGEVALVEEKRLQSLPGRLDALRDTNIYEFTRGEILAIEVAGSLGKVRVKREAQSNGQGVQEQWTLEQPAIRGDPDGLESFLDGIFTIRIREDGFLGVQPDLALCGLQPPMITVTFELKRRSGAQEKLVYGFGFKGSGDAYLRKPGSDEVYAVSADKFRMLDRLDLNFRDPVMFNVPRNSILEISSDIQDETQLGRRAYFWVARDRDRWRFKDTINKGEVDARKLSDVLTLVNFIRAQSLISRRAEVAKEYGLDVATTAGRLEVVYDDGGPRRKVLRLSKPVKLAGGLTRIRYGRFEDDPIIFIVPSMLVEKLEQGVLFEKEGDPGARPPDK